MTGVLLDKSTKSWKMGSGPGSPFGPEDKSPPEPPGCLTLEDLQTLHIPNKQETGGLDTIQATSFFPGWLLLFFQNNVLGKERFVKTILKSGKIPRNHRHDMTL